MGMDDERDRLDVMVITDPYAADLKGRQSVRTTFKLPPRCIDALSLLAGQLGIKQKSIVDHLVDDIQALHELARGGPNAQSASVNRVAKTYVISRRTLENLERVSKRFQTPRDTLVESSIERIVPLLREERRKHERRKQLLQQTRRLLDESQALLAQAEHCLDHDDPVFDQVVQISRVVKSSCAEVEQIIERGRRLEDFS